VESRNPVERFYRWLLSPSYVAKYLVEEWTKQGLFGEAYPKT